MAAGSQPGRDVAGPTASISRQRWMNEDAQGPTGGSSVATAAEEEASKGAGDVSRKTAARAATGRVAEASAVISASLARWRWSTGGGAGRRAGGAAQCGSGGDG